MLPASTPTSAPESMSNATAAGALSYFCLPDSKTRQFGAVTEVPQSVLALSVFCDLGKNTGGSSDALTLVELKGYCESSEFADTVPGLARAQSHTADVEYDTPVPTMMRGTSAIESGQSGVSRELVELSLQEVRQERVSDHSHNFFLPMQNFYFDGSFEVHGALRWSCDDADTADQMFHFSLQLPNSCHTHFAQVAYGAIFTPHTSAMAIAQGLLTSMHPLVSDMMQIRPLGRTYCYSDTFWVIRALFTYFQSSSAAFPSLSQGDALLALAGHVSSLRGAPKNVPRHAPLLLAGVGVITSLFAEQDITIGSFEGNKLYGDESLSLLSSLAGSFFQPAHKELLKQLCDVNSSEGKGKQIFFESDHFFEYFRSLRQALLFLLGADTRGASTGSPCFPCYVALRHVVPLLQKPKMAALRVAELYLPESEVLVKANVDRLETSLRDELWTKLHKYHYVSGVLQYPATVQITSLHRAKQLISLIGDLQLVALDEQKVGHTLSTEILKMQQYQEQVSSSRDNLFKDTSPALLDPTAYIRKLKVFQASIVNMTRHLADFASFFATYTQQCTEGATFSNFWSVEEYRAGVKYLTAETNHDQQTGMLLLWAGGVAGAESTTAATKGSTLPLMSLEQFSMKQPWGITSEDVISVLASHSQQPSTQPSLLVSGANSTLHLLHSHSARTVVANGPGALMGGLDVAQLRAAKSLCTYTLPLRDGAVTLLIIADTGNNSLRALVLSSSLSKKNEANKDFPEGKLFELAKISNPVSVCVFQEQIVVASHNTHVLYSVICEQKSKVSNKVCAFLCIPVLCSAKQVVLLYCIFIISEISFLLCRCLIFGL